MLKICFLSSAPVPVIKKTWEKDAFFIEYYSDHADPSIPTIDIGVPNTERGKSLLFWLNPLSCTVSCVYIYRRRYMKNERTE